MQKEFDIDRKKIWKYVIACGSLIILSVAAPLCIVIFILVCVLLFNGMLPDIPLTEKTLWYRLEGNALWVDHGVIIKSRKSIPLDKIAALELSRGPLLKCFDMWIINVYTSNDGSRFPEAVLLGCINPERVQEDVLAAREEYLKSR